MEANLPQVTLTEKGGIKDDEIVSIKQAENTLTGKEGWVIRIGNEIVYDKLFVSEASAKKFVKQNPIWMTMMAIEVCKDKSITKE